MVYNNFLNKKREKNLKEKPMKKEIYKKDCITQGEKSSAYQRSQEKGHRLNELLAVMDMSRLTYCYELGEVDAFALRNNEL